jgi:hypothetical protein
VPEAPLRDHTRAFFSLNTARWLEATAEADLPWSLRAGHVVQLRESEQWPDLDPAFVE